MEGMEADFWRYVEAESRTTQNLVSMKIEPELQHVYQELLEIDHAAQVLLLLHPLVCLYQRPSYWLSCLKKELVYRMHGEFACTYHLL